MATTKQRSTTAAAVAAALCLSACAATVDSARIDPITADTGPAPTEPVGISPTDSTLGVSASSTSVATSVAPPEAPSGATTTVPPAPATVVPLTGWPAVDQYLDVTIVRGGSAAVSYAIMRDGTLEHEGAFGERIAGDVVEPGDRFRVASISKVITSVAVLRLVEAGVLALDAPIGTQLAAAVGVNSPVAGVADITVRDLLSHRSGFAQYENLFFRNQVGSCREAAVQGFTRQMQGAPGVKFQYSNLNFCLLDIAIETSTGRPVEAVVYEEVFTPLGISGPRLAGTFDVDPGDVAHRSDEGRNYMEVLESAGAWIAAPRDLVQLLDALDAATLGEAPLSAGTLSEMKTITTDPPAPVPVPEPGEDDATGPAPTTTLPPPRTSGYGLGLMIFEDPLGDDLDEISFGHTGTLESTHAMFMRRADGITWAITVSGDYPSSTRDLAKIMNNALVLGGFVDGDYVAVPPPLDQR